MENQKVNTLIISENRLNEDPAFTAIDEMLNIMHVCDNIDEGLNLYRRNHPELIILEQDISLESLRKIKEADKRAKIILVSSRLNSKYLLDAYDYGIEGLLTKPVDRNKLDSLLSRLTFEIMLERKSADLEKRRRRAEKARRKSEEILMAVSYSAEQFLKFNYNKQSVKSVLKRLGEATRVSHIYIFQSHNNEKEKLYAKKQFDWSDCENAEDSCLPDLKFFYDVCSKLQSWVDELKKGNVIDINVKELPQKEAELLFTEKIKSIIAVPIFVYSNWWGFIWLDDCKKEHEWTKPEISALKTAANILGAALHRQEVERELLRLNSELESRINTRTKDLQDKIVEKATIETMLRESEEKYRQIFENANDGILLTMDGIIKFINPKLYEMTGYLPKESIGKPFAEFLHPDYKDMVLEYHYKRLQGQEVPERYDIEFIDKKGNLRWFEIKSTLIQWEESPAVLSFLTDITERKKYSEELRELNRNLEKRVKEELAKIQHQQHLLIQKSKLESLGELAAGMAHEINQPLGSISMGIENILMKYSNESLTEAYLKRKTDSLFQDISRIRKIIEHVRTFSRDQQQDEKLEQISVNDVIINALSLITTQYKHHNINLSLELSSNDCFTYGNKYKLEQVILNILSNAKYAIDEKALRVKNHHYQKKITIRTSMEDDRIRIEIVDNGIGISEDIIDNIFDPFFTTKKEESGTGLGLSIIYGIIKEMKGEISADSQEGEYTRIKVIIPEYKEKEAVK